jgi:hypothetical protein
MFNILSHQGNANQDKFHLTPVRMAKIKTQVTADAGKDVEKEEHSSISGGIASWFNHYGNQFGDSSENWTYYYLRTQLYHSCIYTQKMFHLVIRTHVLLCS